VAPYAYGSLYADPYPPAYIEQSPADPSQSAYYFCPGSNMYYPYVTDCPEGWQPLSTQPPPG
jgi:hypothetical protein